VHARIPLNSIFYSASHNFTKNLLILPQNDRNNKQTVFETYNDNLVTFIIKRFFWIENANYDKILIQFSQLSVIFQQNLVILRQNVPVTP
jgi:hypothetical protein